MPRTKLQQTMAGADWSEFEKKIRILMIRAEIHSLEAVAKMIGCSGPSLRAWVKNPLTMRVDTLLHVMKALKATKEDMNEVMGMLEDGHIREHIAS